MPTAQCSRLLYDADDEEEFASSPAVDALTVAVVVGVSHGAVKSAPFESSAYIPPSYESLDCSNLDDEVIMSGSSPEPVCFSG